MNCEKAREEFSALLDGEIAPDVRDAVEAHLAECSECLRQLDGFRRVNRLYAGLEHVHAPEELEQRVHDAVSPLRFRTAGRARRRWVIPYVAAAAALALMIGGAWKLSRVEEPEFEMAQSVQDSPAINAPAPQEKGIAETAAAPAAEERLLDKVDDGYAGSDEDAKSSDRSARDNRRFGGDPAGGARFGAAGVDASSGGRNRAAEGNAAGARELSTEGGEIESRARITPYAAEGTVGSADSEPEISPEAAGRLIDKMDTNGYFGAGHLAKDKSDSATMSDETVLEQISDADRDQSTSRTRMRIVADAPADAVAAPSKAETHALSELAASPPPSPAELAEEMPAAPPPVAAPPEKGLRATEQPAVPVEGLEAPEAAPPAEEPRMMAKAAPRASAHSAETEVYQSALPPAPAAESAPVTDAERLETQLSSPREQDARGDLDDDLPRLEPRRSGEMAVVTAARTLRYRDGVWIQSEYRDEQLTSVQRGKEAWNRLKERDPSLVDFEALEAPVIFRAFEKWYRLEKPAKQG